MQFEDFIEYVEDHCTAHGMKFIKGERSVTYPGSDSPCNGYFDGNCNPPVLASALEAPEAFTILVHEFCHSMQFLENCVIWQRHLPTEEQKKKYGECSDDILFHWVDGKIEVPEQELDSIFNGIIGVELDCEKRVVKLIDELNLDIDKDLYIQRANAYVYFYLYLRKYRKWYSIDKEPYNISDVYVLMPTDFETLTYTGKIDPFFEGLFKTYC